MNYWKVLKRTVLKFIEDDPLSYSSSIAFYVVFSLPAILIIVISIAGSFYEDQVVRNSLLDQIRQLFGADSATTVDKILANTRVEGSTLLAKVVGIVTLVFSATTVFLSLQAALNSIWRVKPKPNMDFLKFIRDRLLTLAMVISIGFLLLVSLVLDAFIAILNQALASWFSEDTYYIIWGINVLVSIFVIASVFAMVFKFLPDAKINWPDVRMGAFVTALLFLGGKYLIGFYLGNSSLNEVYGAAGSFVLLLLWVYYSSMILLLGAEFTYVYSRELGHKIKPSQYAVKIRQVEDKKEVANKKFDKEIT